MIVTVTNPPTSELPVLRRVVRSSTIDLIADQLRNAIYSGSLEPGQSINEVRTAELLVVSRPSLREALQRLISEGVMTHSPGRGVRVRRMAEADIDDVYAVREAVETQAVRLNVRGRRPSRSLHLALGRLEEAIEGELARAIGDADLAFHHALVACSGSNRLTELMQVSMVHTRLLSLSDERGYEVRCDIADSHRQLTEAIDAGDEAGGVAIVSAIMAEAASRLHGPEESVAAVTLRSEGEPAAEGDQWLRLREDR